MKRICARNGSIHIQKGAERNRDRTKKKKNVNKHPQHHFSETKNKTLDCK